MNPFPHPQSKAASLGSSPAIQSGPEPAPAPAQGSLEWWNNLPPSTQAYYPKPGGAVANTLDSRISDPSANSALWDSGVNYSPPAAPNSQPPNTYTPPPRVPAPGVPQMSSQMNVKEPAPAAPAPQITSMASAPVSGGGTYSAPAPVDAVALPKPGAPAPVDAVALPKPGAPVSAASNVPQLPPTDYSGMNKMMPRGAAPVGSGGNGVVNALMRRFRPDRWY